MVWQWNRSLSCPCSALGFLVLACLQRSVCLHQAVSQTLSTPVPLQSPSLDKGTWERQQCLTPILKLDMMSCRASSSATAVEEVRHVSWLGLPSCKSVVLLWRACGRELGADVGAEQPLRVFTLPLSCFLPCCLSFPSSTNYQQWPFKSHLETTADCVPSFYLNQTISQQVFWVKMIYSFSDCRDDIKEMSISMTFLKGCALWMSRNVYICFKMLEKESDISVLLYLIFWSEWKYYVIAKCCYNNF